MPSEFVITNRLLSALLDLYTLDLTIKNTPIAVSIKKDFTQQNFINNVYYLSNLLDLKVSSAQAKKYALGRNVPSTNERDKKIINIRNVIEYIRSSASDSRLTLQIILHINKLLTDGIVEIWDVSRLRNPGESSVTSNIFNVKLIDLVKDNYLLLNNNISLLYSPEFEDTNFLIKIALFSYYLFLEKPFASYNDLTVIFLVHYLFFKGQFNKFFSIGKVFSKNFDELSSALEAKDLNKWVEVLSVSIKEELQNINDLVKPMSLLKEDKKKDRFLDLNKRQLRILHYIADNGDVSRELVSKLNNTSIATAFRDLDFLCKKKYLQRIGNGKGTKYTVLKTDNPKIKEEDV